MHSGSFRDSWVFLCWETKSYMEIDYRFHKLRKLQFTKRRRNHRSSEVRGQGDGHLPGNLGDKKLEFIFSLEEEAKHFSL